MVRAFKAKNVLETKKYYQIEKKVKLIETKFARKRGERVHAEIKTA